MEEENDITMENDRNEESEKGSGKTRSDSPSGRSKDSNNIV